MPSDPIDTARQEYLAAGPAGIKPGLALARLLLAEQEFSEADAVLSELLAQRPGHDMARRLRARALLGMGQQAQAIAVLGEIYTKAADLTLRRLSSARYEPGPELAPWLAKLVLHREFKVLSSEESRQFLATRLSSGQQAIAEGKDWFFHLKNGTAQPDELTVPDLTMRMLDTCLMLEEGQPRVFNPLTGKLSGQVYSILPDLVLLRDGSEHVWVSCVPKLFASTTLESVYLLPKEKLILDTRNSDGATTRDLLFPNLLYYLRHYENLHHVPAGEPHTGGMTVADRPLDHLAHYVWNGISAWSTLLASGLFRNADSLASWTTVDYFGDPFELYPEFQQAGLNTLRINCIEDAIAHIAHSGQFWLPMYERFIRRDLTERIARSCAARTHSQFIEDLKALRQKSSPLVLLTLRMGNRVWVNQEAGYANLIRCLSAQFPGAGFILDGMTRTKVIEQSAREDTAVREERELARRIIAAAGTDARILNAIGVPLTESVVACGEVDIFIAPWGTGMTKYKWIHNKPGIAFGNSLPDEAAFSGIGIRVFDSFRENGVKAVEFPPEHIHDAGEGDRTHALRRNFDLPWKVLVEMATSLLQDLGHTPAATGPEVP